MSTLDECSQENIEKNPLLLSPCSCLASTNAIVELVDQYKKNIDTYNADYIKSEQVYAQYKIDYTNWEKNKQNKINELNNERKLLNNCLNANGGYTDAFCENDIGSGWYQVGWEQSYCGLYRRGVCQRRPQQVINDIGPWLSQNPEPPKPPPFSKEFPKPPSGNNIQCCSQVFDNFSTISGNINLNDINQQCTQEINKKITQVATPIISNEPMPLISNEPMPSPTQIPMKLLLIFGGLGLLLLIIIIIIFVS